MNKKRTEFVARHAMHTDCHYAKLLTLIEIIGWPSASEQMTSRLRCFSLKLQFYIKDLNTDFSRDSFVQDNFELITIIDIVKINPYGNLAVTAKVDHNFMI